MLQPLPQLVSVTLPNIIRGVRVACLPNMIQTRVTKGDDAQEVVKRVEGGPPAEVRMLRWVIVSLENPVGWYFRDDVFLCLIVWWEVDSWRQGRR